MSQITIQCRLVASEPTRKLLWELMAEKNTPLINEILCKINNHSDFEEWQSEGKLPGTLVSDLCKSLKDNSLYSGQPSRFYLSITKLVNYIYKSWLKLQQRRYRQLEGQEHWLSMLKSDTELLKESEYSLDILRKKAREILNDVEAEIEKSKKKANNKKASKKPSLLFNLYDGTKEENVLTRSAICYLLKNGSKLPKPDKPIVQSEIKAKAEAKIPGYEEGQKKYAKQYRINIHNWSYGRLIENITTQSSKVDIAIKEVKQSVRGSPTEKARDMAIVAYQAIHNS